MALLSLTFVFLALFSNLSSAAPTEGLPTPTPLPSDYTRIYQTTTRRPPDPGATGRPHSPWRQNRTRESAEIHNFFKLFGWLRRNDTIRDDDIPAAIRKIQKILHEPETGVYDDSIENVMAKPHCGTEPAYNETDAKSDVPLAKRYAIWGPRWDRTSLTYRFINFTADLAADKQRAIIRLVIHPYRDHIKLTPTKQCVHDVDQSDTTLHHSSSCLHCCPRYSHPVCIHGSV